MSFSIKQLLIFVFLVATGTVALANAENYFAANMVRLATTFVLILTAYGIWSSVGETRVFRVGFLCWCGIYFLLHVVLDVKNLNIGTSYFVSKLSAILEPGIYERNAQGRITGIHGALLDRFELIAHSLFSLLFGLIGGWITLYFYRRRQRVLGRSSD